MNICGSELINENVQVRLVGGKQTGIAEIATRVDNAPPFSFKVEFSNEKVLKPYSKDLP